MNKIRNMFNIDRLERLGYTGTDCGVAILDTGMYMHQDLRKNIDCFKDFVNNRTAPYDDNSHGTHVAGIIASSGESCNRKYRGIAPDSRLIILKILDKHGNGDSSTLIRACDWILENQHKYNIKVVNVSIGSESSKCSDEQSDLVCSIDMLWDNGITVVASAGNNGPGKGTITMPGISRKIITVGSSSEMPYIDFNGKKKITYSSEGPTHCSVNKPDIIAPGLSIISCYSSGRSYAAKSGTSMSTPIVSGAAAIACSASINMTNNGFKRNLCDSADDLGFERSRQGHGQINFLKLFSI